MHSPLDLIQLQLHNGSWQVHGRRHVSRRSAYESVRASARRPSAAVSNNRLATMFDTLRFEPYLFSVSTTSLVLETCPHLRYSLLPLDIRQEEVHLGMSDHLEQPLWQPPLVARQTLSWTKDVSSKSININWRLKCMLRKWQGKC